MLFYFFTCLYFPDFNNNLTIMINIIIRKKAYSLHLKAHLSYWNVISCIRNTMCSCFPRRKFPCLLASQGRELTEHILYLSTEIALSFRNHLQKHVNSWICLLFVNYSDYASVRKLLAINWPFSGNRLFMVLTGVQNRLIP